VGRGKVLRDDGSVSVEFVLVIPLVILVLLGALEVIGVAKSRIELEAAAREGARVAATTPDPARAVEAVRGVLGDEGAAKARITVERPTVVGALARVVVLTEHRLSIPGGLVVPVSAEAVMRVER